MISFPVCPLFVPGNKLDWIEKAESSDADGLIIDLEDSVPAKEKSTARKELDDFLISTIINKPYLIRINPLTSEDGPKDLYLAKKTNDNFLGFLIPKIESSTELSLIPESINIVLLIETPSSLQNISLLIEDRRVIGLALGGVDLAAELGSDTSWDSLLTARSTIILQASKYGLFTIDSPYIQIDNLIRLEEESLRAKAIGFNSKFAIHPRQAAVIKNSFLPSENEIQEAKKIIKAFSISEGGAISVDGKMIDEAVVRLMKKRLILAGLAQKS
mgnify:CR=1 FL=1